MKRIPLPWSTLHAFTTVGSKKFMPVTPWINAADVKRLRATFELIQAQTDFRMSFAYQTANVENAPDAAVEVGSVQTADGMNYGTVTDVSNNTGGKQLVRFGLFT